MIHEAETEKNIWFLWEASNPNLRISYYDISLLSYNVSNNNFTKSI